MIIGLSITIEFNFDDNGYLKKVLQKLLIFRQFSSYSVVLWHRDCLKYFLAKAYLDSLKILPEDTENGIFYIGVICIKP